VLGLKEYILSLQAGGQRRPPKPLRTAPGTDQLVAQVGSAGRGTCVALKACGISSMMLAWVVLPPGCTIC
jgi:hypothetical protein